MQSSQRQVHKRFITLIFFQVVWELLRRLFRINIEQWLSQLNYHNFFIFFFSSRLYQALWSYSDHNTQILHGWYIASFFIKIENRMKNVSFVGQRPNYVCSVLSLITINSMNSIDLTYCTRKKILIISEKKRINWKTV